MDRLVGTNIVKSCHVAISGEAIPGERKGSGRERSKGPALIAEKVLQICALTSLCSLSSSIWIATSYHLPDLSVLHFLYGGGGALQVSRLPGYSCSLVLTLSSPAPAALLDLSAERFRDGQALARLDVRLGRAGNVMLEKQIYFFWSFLLVLLGDAMK
ncbi:hypothetical protein KFK09_003530 [Dendrobium nobile]|uniref:Uncharacterized protein n=1 Tax=Dendrobium nobile TaxID=94219 RepID=A0A8T3BXY5_DENNO|nr:hypothetical protein KFK09_003530 [Dendrobium nobile]